MRAVTPELMRALRGLKWHRYGVEVVPAWIADMDFGVAPAVRAAVRRLADEEDLNYATRHGGRPEQAVRHAFADRMSNRHKWTVAPDLVQPISDLVQGVHAAIAAFTAPGDAAVVHTPCYPPIRHAVTSTGRRFLPCPLVDTAAGFQVDLDALDHALSDPGARLLFLCNPHNPTGRVLTEAELVGIASVVAAHPDLVVVSDEIHADLTYDGHRHLPFGRVAGRVAEQVITLSSPVKAFNIAGLRCAVMHLGSATLQQELHDRIPPALLGRIATPAVDGAVAAWTRSTGWHRDVLARLAGNRARVREALDGPLRGVRGHPPDGTYLYWLDFTAVHDAADHTIAERLRTEAGVALSDGTDFDPACRGWARLNFATSPAILDEILRRITTALAEQ